MWTDEKDRDMRVSDCSVCHPDKHDLCRCSQMCNQHQREAATAAKEET